MPAEGMGDTEIDAVARYLRETLQGGKTLTPWPMTPKATKRKWLELAAGALAAAESARAAALKDARG
jgi:hypothetical protein